MELRSIIQNHQLRNCINRQEIKGKKIILIRNQIVAKAKVRRIVVNPNKQDLKRKIINLNERTYKKLTYIQVLNITNKK